uniref:Uncharacterized protein n=1 Tax=Arundo donax TaxID=35708 RepID=A0A0A9BJ84_ARUDO
MLHLNMPMSNETRPVSVSAIQHKEQLILMQGSVSMLYQRLQLHYKTVSCPVGGAKQGPGML